MTVDNPNIPNPKTILQASVNNMDALRAQLVNTRQDYIDGTLLGPIDDAIEVLSMPVFMVVQAVESMYVQPLPFPSPNSHHPDIVNPH